MRRLRSRAGQIVIPAIMIFPTLVLFVFLIYETAKLSREKIKHQFAIDAAAFVEMTNYSDFLNRTAYVNGAFPMRIFWEGYHDFPAECEGKVANCQKVNYDDILYKNGAFPRAKDYGKKEFTTEGVWDIQYCDGNNPIGCGPAVANKNSSPPELTEPFDLFTMEDANKFWHQYDLATEIYKLYVQIYSLLGSVESAQFDVLKRLSGDHSFLRKSYWLNSGDPVNQADLLSQSWNVAMGDFNGSVEPVCQQKLMYWGNKHLGGGGIQPYTPTKTDPPVTLQTTPPCSQGLFQLMYVKPSIIERLRSNPGGGYPGLPLWMNWAIPETNYWNVDFPTLMAQQYPNGSLRTTISLMGDPKNTPSVWPNPTPKFQVRQFP